MHVPKPESEYWAAADERVMSPASSLPLRRCSSSQVIGHSRRMTDEINVPCRDGQIDGKQQQAVRGSLSKGGSVISASIAPKVEFRHTGPCETREMRLPLHLKI